MFDEIEKMMRRLDPVTGKSAGVACAIGFLFGGIGLAIYFRNMVDLVFPIAIALLSMILLGVDVAWLVGGIVAALYGYFRVIVSNDVLAQRAAATR